MAVQCPFCGSDWAESVILCCALDAEPGECDCGAWWYEGMDDVTEASVSTKEDVEDD
jgi:hypothetical protein